MEYNTEHQIISELKNINKSLHTMNEKIDAIDKGGKPAFNLWEIIRSLLIGVCIVGPGLAVTIVVFQVIYSWLFN